MDACDTVACCSHMRHEHQVGLPYRQVSTARLLQLAALAYSLRMILRIALLPVFECPSEGHLESNRGTRKGPISGGVLKLKEIRKVSHSLRSVFICGFGCL